MSDENTTHITFACVVEKGARGYIHARAKKVIMRRRENQEEYTLRRRDDARVDPRKRGRGKRFARVEVLLEYVHQSTFRRLGEEKS